MTKLIIKSIPKRPDENMRPYLERKALDTLRSACPIELEVEIID